VRKSFKLTDSLDQVIYDFSEGNFGALSVVMKIDQRADLGGFLNLLKLDDMNIRGTQIWYGYKDYCKEELELFVKCLNDPNEAEQLCKAINVRAAYYEGENAYKAVTHGASYSDREKLRLTKEEVVELKKNEPIVHPEAKKKTKEKNIEM